MKRFYLEATCSTINNERTIIRRFSKNIWQSNIPVIFLPLTFHRFKKNSNVKWVTIKSLTHGKYISIPMRSRLENDRLWPRLKFCLCSYLRVNVYYKCLQLNDRQTDSLLPSRNRGTCNTLNTHNVNANADATSVRKLIRFWIPVRVKWQEQNIIVVSELVWKRRRLHLSRSKLQIVVQVSESQCQKSDERFGEWVYDSELDKSCFHT